MALVLPTGWLTVNVAPTAAEVKQLFDAITQAYGIRSLKSADETWTSNTTLHNDAELTVAVAANTTYTIESVLYVFGASAGDIKCALAFPSGTCTAFGGMGLTTASVAASTSADVDVHAFASTGTSPTSALTFGVPDTNGVTVKFWATIAVGATAGAITLQWAQNASSGTGTTVKAGSWFRAYAE